MKNLIETWRAIWSAVPGTTESDFPFGIVSLAGGTSEGNSQVRTDPCCHPIPVASS